MFIVPIKKQRTQTISNGFTLLEILIALFIFSMISLMLTTALRSVMDAQSETTLKAERLNRLQFALLMLSRDVEQIVNRPILNAKGNEEAALIGTPQALIFTHTGFANPTGELLRSSLSRTGFVLSDGTLSRLTWLALDQAPNATAHRRLLLSNVTGHFEYLDQEGRFHEAWPVDEKKDQPLPKAVKIKLTITRWGSIDQLYVIPVQINQKATSRLPTSVKP